MTPDGSALVIEHVNLYALHPDRANPRRISEDELDALTRSLREFGFVQPVLVRREDSTVIGGHQRLVAARRLGMTSVPVIRLDISIEQARLLGLALNRISGDWDDQLLARLLGDLQADPSIDVTLTGFGEDEVAGILRSLNAREKREQPESFDLDDALADATRSPRTKPGDLWLVGEHRLLCGDATKPEGLARLLGSDRPGMAFTDPPYNVALGDHGGHQRGARRRRLANDALDPAAWEMFVREWARPLLGAVDGAVYICRDGAFVLDPFLGSGSTLIACERTGRRCLGIELDPVYVEVALRRWERFSGLTAVKADG